MSLKDNNPEAELDNALVPLEYRMTFDRLRRKFLETREDLFNSHTLWEKNRDYRNTRALVFAMGMHKAVAEEFEHFLEIAENASLLGVVESSKKMIMHINGELDEHPLIPATQP